MNDVTDLGRVLVTGGGGFLGTGIVRLLRERGLLRFVACPGNDILIWMS